MNLSRAANHKRNDFGRNLTVGMLDTLGKAIVTEQYLDRPFPTEAEISREHGVSRSVTREAVKMLTAKGLVSAKPRQGTIVQPATSWNLFDPDVLRWLLERKFSKDLLRQFTELRAAIEPEAAALASLRRTASDLLDIQRGLARMEAADLGQGDPLEADIEFHVAILRASKNPFFLQFEAVVSTALQTSIAFTNEIRGSASIPEHAAVADAISRSDAEEARLRMRALVTDVLQLIRSTQGAQQLPR
jgi:DNA-binding FadR family transcriptional regulator